jgi:hypothetical protein
MTPATTTGRVSPARRALHVLLWVLAGVVVLMVIGAMLYSFGSDDDASPKTPPPGTPNAVQSR